MAASSGAACPDASAPGFLGEGRAFVIWLKVAQPVAILLPPGTG